MLGRWEIHLFPHGRLASSLLSFSRRSAYNLDADGPFAIYQSPTAAYYITAKWSQVEWYRVTSGNRREDERSGPRAFEKHLSTAERARPIKGGSDFPPQDTSSRSSLEEQAQLLSCPDVQEPCALTSYVSAQPQNARPYPTLLPCTTQTFRFHQRLRERVRPPFSFCQYVVRRTE